MLGPLIERGVFIERGVIRKLWAGDTDQLVEHFKRLDGESRKRRFMGLVSDTHLENHARRAVRPDTVIYGYFDRSVLRAAAELHSLRGADTGDAEGALSVESEWQRRGVGTELFRCLVDSARDRGVRRLTLNCLPGNRAMQRLCARFGAKVRLAGGEAVAQLDAIGATPMSFIAQANGRSSAKAPVAARQAA